MRSKVPELCHRMEDGTVLRWRMCRLMVYGITLTVRDADRIVLFGDEEW